MADVLAVLAEFGCTESCNADVNADGSVNVGDVLALLAAFGTPCVNPTNDENTSTIVLDCRIACLG